jgi:hypothetical protein
MTTPGQGEQHEPKAAPLGSETEEPDGDDDAAMAGPVYPPEETEPDAH